MKFEATGFPSAMVTNLIIEHLTANIYACHHIIMIEESYEMASYSNLSHQADQRALDCKL